MQKQIFRQETMDRLRSPEDLNDYLHVTKKSTWVVLGIIVFLLAALIVWSATTQIASVLEGTAVVENGQVTITFTSDRAASYVKAGVDAMIGETEVHITSVGQDSDGNLIAVGEAAIPDGSYAAQVAYRYTRLIEMLIG